MREWIKSLVYVCPNNMIMKKKININDAEHPARRLAISIIENEIESITGKYLRGEKYYHLEDAITMRIDKIIK